MLQTWETWICPNLLRGRRLLRSDPLTIRTQLLDRVTEILQVQRKLMCLSGSSNRSNRFFAISVSRSNHFLFSIKSLLESKRRHPVYYTCLLVIVTQYLFKRESSFPSSSETNRQYCLSVSRLCRESFSSASSKFRKLLPCSENHGRKEFDSSSVTETRD